MLFRQKDHNLWIGLIKSLIHANQIELDHAKMMFKEECKDVFAFVIF